MNNWLMILFCLIGGALYSLGFPSKSLPHFMPFSLLGMGLLCFCIKEVHSKSRNLLYAILFSLGYNIVGYSWIPYTLNQFGDIYYPLAYLLSIFFSLFIAPHLLIFAFGFKFFSKYTNSTSFQVRALIYAFLLTALEYFVPQQFPAHLGHPWLQLAPYIGLATFGGVPLFSFVSYWIIFSLINFINKKKISYLFIVSIIIFLITNFIFPLQKNQKPTHFLNIRLVQANVGNFMKIESEKGFSGAISDIFKRYQEMSTAKSELELDMIIWPETAYPSLLDSDALTSYPETVPSLISDIIFKTNAYLFAGVYDTANRENNNFFETEHNATFLFNKKSLLSDFYHKQILIPFGENLPFGPLNKHIGKYISNISFFAKGTRNTLFKVKDDISFISFICYEILFPEYIRSFLSKLKERPFFIINPTNDSWYGDTSEPFQHMFLTKWRAVEFKMPLVRITNTGISSIIFPDGSETKRLLPFTKNTLDHKLRLKRSVPTWYERFGILITIFIFTGLIITQVIISRIRLSKDRTSV